MLNYLLKFQKVLSFYILSLQFKLLFMLVLLLFNFVNNSSKKTTILQFVWFVEESLII